MLLGWISQMFFALCLGPQLVKSFIVKTVKGVSLEMWIMQALGYVFGLFYGLKIHQKPLIIGNIWGLVCSVIFLFAYFKYRDK